MSLMSSLAHWTLDEERIYEIKDVYQQNPQTEKQREKTEKKQNRVSKYYGVLHTHTHNYHIHNRNTRREVTEKRTEIFETIMPGNVPQIIVKH